MYEVEIRNGLELLDAKLGRDAWLPRVDEKTIVMSDCFSCVAAQAVGAGYIDSMRELGVHPPEGESTLTIDAYETECRYGFEIWRGMIDTPGSLVKKYEILTREWRDTITAMKFPTTEGSSL